jgi:hypothetical protein
LTKHEKQRNPENWTPGLILDESFAFEIKNRDLEKMGKDVEEISRSLRGYFENYRNCRLINVKRDPRINGNEWIRLLVNFGSKTPVRERIKYKVCLSGYRDPNYEGYRSFFIIDVLRLE